MFIKGCDTLTSLLKDVNQQQDEEIHRVRSWTRSFCPHVAWGPAWRHVEAVLVPQVWKLPEKGQKSCSLGVFGGFIAQYDWLSYWPLADYTASPPALPRGERQDSRRMAGLPGTQPLPSGRGHKSPSLITRHPFLLCGSLVFWRMVDEVQIYLRNLSWSSEKPITYFLQIMLL